MLIAREISGELRRLLRHEPAQPEDEGKGKDHDDSHADAAWNLQPSQEQKCRREHEAQQNGESERQKHLARNIKSGDDDGGNEQALKRRGARF